jgi:hypothetical protein
LGLHKFGSLLVRNQRIEHQCLVVGRFFGRWNKVGGDGSK